MRPFAPSAGTEEYVDYILEYIDDAEGDLLDDPYVSYSVTDGAELMLNG